MRCQGELCAGQAILCTQRALMCCCIVHPAVGGRLGWTLLELVLGLPTTLQGSCLLACLFLPCLPWCQNAVLWALTLSKETETGRGGGGG